MYLLLIIAILLRPGKKVVEDCRQQLSAAKNHAESIAMITPELERAFVQVFIQ